MEKLLLILILLCPTGIFADVLPEANGIALAGVKEFALMIRASTTPRFESRYPQNSFAEQILAPLESNLRRDGVVIDYNNSDVIFCDMTALDVATGNEDEIAETAYFLQISYYLKAPEGVDDLIWQNSGLYIESGEALAPNLIAGNCADLFLTEWLRWNIRQATP